MEVELALQGRAVPREAFQVLGLRHDLTQLLAQHELGID